MKMWIGNDFSRYTPEQKALAIAEVRAFQQQEWAKREIELKKAAGYHGRVRNARLKENGGSHTQEQAAAVLEAQKWLCVMCDADLKTVRKEKDHIRPVAKGGSNDIVNIQWLCRRCNASKNDSWTPQIKGKSILTV